MPISNGTFNVMLEVLPKEQLENLIERQVELEQYETAEKIKNILNKKK